MRKCARAWQGCHLARARTRSGADRTGRPSVTPLKTRLNRPTGSAAGWMPGMCDFLPCSSAHFAAKGMSVRRPTALRCRKIGACLDEKPAPFRPQRLSAGAATPKSLDHDDFGLDQSKVMNVIDFIKCRAGCGRKTGFHFSSSRSSIGRSAHLHRPHPIHMMASEALYSPERLRPALFVRKIGRCLNRSK